MRIFIICVGRNGFNNCENDNDDHHQSWPERSIFHTKDFMMPKLNRTLSMTCSVNEVEELKACLFRDPFEAWSAFMNLYKNGRADFKVNEDAFFCCSCEYAKCTHFKSVLDAVAKDYFMATCSICVFKIERSCNRSADDCCIKRMTKRSKFPHLVHATNFVSNCYYFCYERNYLNFCIEGNIFENTL